MKNSYRPDLLTEARNSLRVPNTRSFARSFVRSPELGQTWKVERERERERAHEREFRFGRKNLRPPTMHNFLDVARGQESFLEGQAERIPYTFARSTFEKGPPSYFPFYLTDPTYVTV